MNKHTERVIRDIIDEFEAEVRRLLDEGHTPKYAVKEAYKKYPVMEAMKDTLIDELVEECARGYGVDIGVTSDAAKSAIIAGMPYKLQTISKAMQKAWAPDGLNLSERLHNASSRVKNDVAAAIYDAMKKGQDTLATAKDIFDGYGGNSVISKAELPDFLEKLRKLSIPLPNDEAGKDMLKYQLRKVRRLVEQETTPGLRAAYSELIDAIEKSNTAALNHTIYVATQEKARYHAERIARTERARAYAEGEIARHMDDPDVVAFQWKLSTRHPVVDICDVYANADLYGLGKGIYPKDKFPHLPAHPHCMCHIKPIIEGMIDTAAAKPNIEAGGLAYLKSLPKREQEFILGVNGRNLVMNGHASWTEEARGWDGTIFKSRLPVIESLKDYIKNGKINIEDLAKRREFETIDDVRYRVIDYINSPYFNSSYVMRQSMHIKGGKLYDETQNKSYYNYEIPHADVIKAIRESVYNGGIRFTRKGDWNHKIMVDISPHIGYDVNVSRGTKQKTSLATVHVSGKGIHIVPKGSERK